MAKIVFIFLGCSTSNFSKSANSFGPAVWCEALFFREAFSESTGGGAFVGAVGDLSKFSCIKNSFPRMGRPGTCMIFDVDFGGTDNSSRSYRLISRSRAFWDRIGDKIVNFPKFRFF